MTPGLIQGTLRGARVGLARLGRAGRRAGVAIALSAGLMLPLSEAGATWSILLVDARTGEIAIGSATCLARRDLQADTPVLITEFGAATAQSFVDTTGQNRRFIANALIRGLTLDEILAELADRDSGHQTRQYGMVDTSADALTFSGTLAGEWKGGETGSFQYTHAGRTGTIYYAVQGNVLTGEPVVQEAIDAMIQTDGDLAARLMAGMEAAHTFGGDGRCSCGSDADACGSPPPGFDPEVDKSAHIGYMMVARAGDASGCTIPSVYDDAPQLTRAAAVIEATGDGMPDLVAAARESLWLIPNETPPGAPLVVFGDGVELASLEPSGLDLAPVAPAHMEVGDVTGDGIDDLVLALSNGGSDQFDGALTLHRGQPDSGFSAPELLGDQGSPAGLVLEDLNGDLAPDLAWTVPAQNQVIVRLNDGQGGFEAPASVTVADPNGIAPLVDPGSGRVDLVVSQSNPGTTVILANDGAGGFTLSEAFLVGASPRGVATGDLDGDGDQDIAVVNFDDESVTTLLRDGGKTIRADFDVGVPAEDVVAADIDDDGDVDLLVRSRRRQPNAMLLNRGDATFEPGPAFASIDAVSLEVEDFNADGAVDLAMGVQSGLGAMNPGVLVNTNTDDAIGPMFSPSGVGCATGDYFLDLNIAFTETSDPDPTLLLREEFDAWRATQEGRPDAVVSIAEPERSELVGDGSSQTTMTITLLDFRGEPIDVPADLTVTHADGSAGISEIGPVADLGGGVFEVTITAGQEPGIDRFRVEADDGLRPVRLMPRPQLRIASQRADLNADGIINADDFFAFLEALASDDLDRCDLTGPGGDGVPDGTCAAEDFFFFLELFAGP